MEEVAEALEDVHDGSAVQKRPMQEDECRGASQKMTCGYRIQAVHSVGTMRWELP